MYLNTHTSSNCHNEYGTEINKHSNNINPIDIIGTDNDDDRRRRDYILSENMFNSYDKKDGDVDKMLIYRFKFTEKFMEELHTFSKIHQYDDRGDFKEAWVTWMEEYNELISDEQKRIISLGYRGDILEKMYKSARYYFRNKTVEKKEPAKRRKYISVSKTLLDSMDEHIRKHMFEKTYQPKVGFELFCNETKDILKEAITKICEEGTLDSILIQEKIKKTYKNRYFVIVKK